MKSISNNDTKTKTDVNNYSKNMESNLLKPGYNVPITNKVVKISQSDLDNINKTSELLYKVGRIVWAKYKSGDTQIRELIEYGLDDVLIKILRKSNHKPDRNLLRFDFILTEDGVKWIECARNPWAIMKITEAREKLNDDAILNFDGNEIYTNMLTDKLLSYGVLIGFGIFDDNSSMINLLSTDFIIKRCDTQTAHLFDKLFVDIDTSFFDRSLPSITDRIDDFMPSVANCIFKHKTFGMLFTNILSGHLDFHNDISVSEMRFLENFILKTQALESADLSIYLEQGGVVKEVVGQGGYQNTMYNPKLNIRNNTKDDFTKHINDSLHSNTTVIQELATPKIFEESYTAEISVILSKNESHYFAKIIPLKNELDEGEHRGIGFVVI